MKDLRGRVAVVTGGANGIGLGLAERFLQEGMKVVIADINEQDLARAEQSLAASGEVLAVTTDVSREDSVQSLADAAVARFGGVHVLCNNAGVGGTQRFDTVGQATWEWTIGVNLWGVVHGCRIFLPILAAQDEAYIVNTASMAGFTSSVPGNLQGDESRCGGPVRVLGERVRDRVPARGCRGAVSGVHVHVDTQRRTQRSSRTHSACCSRPEAQRTTRIRLQHAGTGRDISRRDRRHGGRRYGGPQDAHLPPPPMVRAWQQRVDKVRSQL